MARYELRPRGVWDADLGAAVVPEDGEPWRDYERWIADGNVPDTPATPAVDRAALLDALWSEVKERRRRCVLAGALVVIGGADRWFHTDLDSRTQWLAMRGDGDQLEAGIAWKTMDGSFVQLTPAIVTEVYAAIRAKERAAFVRGEQLWAQLNAAPDPLTVPLDVGWPASFGE